MKMFFFREATLQICSSLNIGEALRSCFDYVKRYIPMNRMYFHTYDAGLNLLRLAAAARDDMMEEPERIIYLPENGRSARAADLTADLLKIDMRHEHARLLKLLHRPFAIAKASAIEHQEVIANAIHYSSPPKDGPFIKVNCGAIPLVGPAAIFAKGYI